MTSPLTRRAAVGALAAAPLLLGCPTPAPAAPVRDELGIAWRNAYATYLRLRGRYEAAFKINASDDAMLSAFADAEDALLTTPAPDLEALLIKVEVARVIASGNIEVDPAASILADVARFAGEAA